MTGRGMKAREISPPLEKKAFCALILPEGIRRFESRSVYEFCHPMKIAQIGWIDGIPLQGKRVQTGRACTPAGRSLSIRNEGTCCDVRKAR